MSNIAFTLRLEPPPVVFSLYGPDGELLHLTPPAQSDQLVGFVGPVFRPAFSRTAGEALGGHRAVKLDSDGKAYYVSPSDADVDAIVGVTSGASSQDTPVNIVLNGEMTENSWTWTPGPVWLGANGVLTQTVPTSGAVVRVGTALGATTMFVEPRLIATF